jgi:arylsulfatase A-like enzyme
LPHVGTDDFATQGVKFMSAYAAAPVCTPTRCAYVTGRYPQRLAVGLEEPLKRTSPPDTGLPPDHPTVASLLKRDGYDTSLVGKWHLGWKPEFGPNRHGFDEFFGILSGAADYFTHRASTRPAVHRRGKAGRGNLTPIEAVGYLTDLLSDKGVESSRGPAKPFFLSLSTPRRTPLGRRGRSHRPHPSAGPMKDGDRSRSTRP